MTEVPDNVDLNWIARTLIGLRDDVRDIKTDLRHVRDDLDVVTMRVIRIDNAVSGLRDQIRALDDLHRELRGRVETLERDR